MSYPNALFEYPFWTPRVESFELNFQGQQLVSRATYTSGRALTASALVVIVVHLFEIDVSGLNVLGVNLTPQDNSGAMIVVIGFLALAHIVQWTGEYLSFKAWNTGKKVGGGNPRGAGGEDLPTELEHVVQQMQHLVRHTQDRRSNPSKSNRHLDVEWEETTSAKDIAWTLRQLENLQRGVGRLRTGSVLTLFGWHLIVPLGLAGYAVCVLSRLGGTASLVT